MDGKTVEVHVEILKRLPGILQFAVQYSPLTDAQVDLLWKGK